jgi:flagellar biosynthesis/type III secretory pathway chaperone
LPAKPPLALPGKPPLALPGKPPPSGTISAGPAKSAGTPRALGTGAVRQADLQDLPGSIAGLVDALHLYNELLTEENELLRLHKTAGVATLLERKQRVTLLYQERLRSMLKDLPTLHALPDQQRSKIRDLAQKLDALASENAVLLRGNMHAIERLFEVINAAVRRHRQQDVTYSKSGRVDFTPLGSSAIAFNSTV